MVSFPILSRFGPSRGIESRCGPNRFVEGPETFSGGAESCGHFKTPSSHSYHTQVQPHMKKCFDGIAHLDFDPDLNILAALDAPPPKGERLEFTYDQCDDKMINPKDSGASSAF